MVYFSFGARDAIQGLPHNHQASACPSNYNHSLCKLSAAPKLACERLDSQHAATGRRVFKSFKSLRGRRKLGRWWHAPEGGWKSHPSLSVHLSVCLSCHFISFPCAVGCCGKFWTGASENCEPNELSSWPLIASGISGERRNTEERCLAGREDTGNWQSRVHQQQAPLCHSGLLAAPARSSRQRSLK